MSKRLPGLTAIVTGASSGLGRAISLAIAAEGAKLVVCVDIRREPRLPEAGDVSTAADTQPTHEQICQLQGEGRSIFVRCDVSLENRMSCSTSNDDPVFGMADVIEKALQLSSRIDLIVNNAGGGVLGVPFHEQDFSDWNKSIQLNLGGSFLGTKHGINQFLKQEPDEHGFRGNIINIASIGARVGLMSCGAYCAAKGGIVSLTKEIAIEYASRGIRCNAILPGYIKTRLTWLSMETDASFREHLARSIPQGRLGQPREVAPAATWLASGRESSYMTGAEIVIDGGFTAA